MTIRAVSMGLLVGGLGAFASASAPGPLEIVERLDREAGGFHVATERSTMAGDRDTMHWKLRNVGETPIVAWHFACVAGTQNGREGWVGQGADAFRALARGDAGSTPPLAPGETLTIEMPAMPSAGSRYEVWACGPTAAITSDLVSWGAPEVLERIFGQRRSEAREARRVLDAIDRLQHLGPSVLSSAEELSSLEAALPGDRWGTYRRDVVAVGESKRPEVIRQRLDTLRERVHEDLSTILSQLRPTDLRALGEEERR